MPRPAASPSQPPSPQETVLEKVWPIATLLLVIAVFGLPQLKMGIRFHFDTVRNLMIAKNFHSWFSPVTGSVSSMGYFQGFALNLLLKLPDMLHVPLDQINIWILCLNALGVILVYRLLVYETDRWTALSICLVLARLATNSRCFYPLWEPTLTPFLVALTFCSLHDALATTGTRRWLGLLIASSAFSLGTQMHLIVFFFLPGMMLVLLPRREGRHIAAALLAAIALGWWLLSRGSLQVNMAMMLSGWKAWHPHKPIGSWENFLPLLGAGAVVFLHRWGAGPSRAAGFGELLQAAALTYTVFVTGEFIFKRGVRLYHLFPLLPLLSVMLGQCLHRAGLMISERWRRLVLLPVMALTLWPNPPADAYSSWRGLKPLSLAEIRALGDAFRTLGFDASSAYRAISSAQKTQTDFQCGLWAVEPPINGLRRIGQGPPWGKRILVTAVPASYQAGPGDADALLVPGAGRLFICRVYQPWVDPARFTVMDSPAPRTLRRDISMLNACYGQNCLDFKLPIKARTRLSAWQGSILRLPVHIPPGRASRIFYVPSLDATGRAYPRCAPRIVRAEGVKARIGPDPRQVELISGQTPQQGFLFVQWPTRDPYCFAPGSPFYPMPTAEMTPKDFMHLRRYLDL